MNPDIKGKWIAALRSGDYKQTRKKLKARNGSMCCLGVLSDIQGCKWRYEDGDYLIPDEEDNVFTSVYGEPPKIYMGGIDNKQRNTLIFMNDGGVRGLDVIKKHSFSEIADYIEENL